VEDCLEEALDDALEAGRGGRSFIAKTEYQVREA